MDKDKKTDKEFIAEQQSIYKEIKKTLEVRYTDPERALKMTKGIISRSQKINYQLGIGEGFNHKGACYWLLGEYENGLNQLSKAYTIATDIKNKNLEAKVLNNFGRIYRNLGDLSQALRNFEEALEINEREHNKINEAFNLINISNLYYDLEDYDSALEYALKALPAFEKNQDPVQLIALYTALGDVYYRRTDFEKAETYFEKGLQLTDENSLNRSLTNAGLGKVYYKKENYPKALSYLKRAFDLAKALNNPEAEITAEFYFARVIYRQGQNKKALHHAKHAYSLAEGTLRKRDLISIHEFLASLYEKLGKIKKAYQHLKTYEQLREDVFRQATMNKLRNLQMKTQMQVAKKEKEVAEKTAHLKQQFLANMSHEIRTPMNAIVGITRLLLQHHPKDDQIKYLNTIKQSSDNLLVIINDILDVSKLEAGKIKIEYVDFSLRQLLQSLHEIMSIKAKQKDLEFTVDIADDLPDRLVGDPTRVNQVLVNLVSNAIKFTHEGFVHVICRRNNLEDDKFILSLDVVDTGIGISKQYVKTIFEGFSQAGTDTARKYGGTGLGLTISKQLIDLMNGEINVESSLNKGTIFSVKIPLRKASQQKLKSKKEEDIEILKKRLDNISLLLVEDNEFNQLVAEDTIKDFLPHVKIKIAGNGQEAIDKIKEHNFDIVLMDIRMPVMNGVETTRYIRTKIFGDKKDIPIIAMTANVIPEDVQRYLEAGMNAYVSKPFQPDELLLKIDESLQGKTKQQEKEKDPQQELKPETKRKQPQIPSKVTNSHFLEKFSGGNRSKRDKYIRMFLENCPKLLHQIDDALAEENFENLKVAAHSMKPQLSYMGVSEEVSNILLIEKSAGSDSHRDRLPLWINHLKKVCQQAFKELNAVLNS